MILEFLGLVATALAVASAGLYVFFKYQYTYWSRRKVPHSSPVVPLGDIKTDKNLSTLFQDFYNASYNEKVYGVWLIHKPVLLVNDLDLARKVLVQDFQYFHGRGSYINEKYDPLSSKCTPQFIYAENYKEVNGLGAVLDWVQLLARLCRQNFFQFF